MLMMPGEQAKRPRFGALASFGPRQSHLTNLRRSHYQTRKSAQLSANSCVISQLLDSPIRKLPPLLLTASWKHLVPFGKDNS